MHRYAVTIHWSDEDAAFIAAAPDLPGCLAHGDTHELALSEVQTAVALWLDTAAEFGDTIPIPRPSAPTKQPMLTARLFSHADQTHTLFCRAIRKTVDSSPTSLAQPAASFVPPSGTPARES